MCVSESGTIPPLHLERYHHEPIVDNETPFLLLRLYTMVYEITLHLKQDISQDTQKHSSLNYKQWYLIPSEHLYALCV